MRGPGLPKKRWDEPRPLHLFHILVGELSRLAGLGAGLGGGGLRVSGCDQRIFILFDGLLRRLTTNRENPKYHHQRHQNGIPFHLSPPGWSKPARNPPSCTPPEIGKRRRDLSNCCPNNTLFLQKCQDFVWFNSLASPWGNIDEILRYLRIPMFDTKVARFD
jgi:hypothetical protein